MIYSKICDACGRLSFTALALVALVLLGLPLKANAAPVNHDKQAMAQMAPHVLADGSLRDIGGSTMLANTVPGTDKISINSLSADTETICHLISSYIGNMDFLWLGATFTAIQMVIILILIANTSRRKQAEKGLRRAHQLLEERIKDRTSEVKESVEALGTVFDASHDGIYIHDITGQILDVNERMLKMYRITRNDIQDLSIARDLSSRDNAVYRLSSTWRSVINGEPQVFEWRARRPHDGSEFDAEIYLTRIVFRSKEAILANVRDITVRKESENRIRQSLSKFEAILENSLVGIAMSQGRKIVSVNRRGAEIFAYSPGELIGNKISLLLNSRDAAEKFIKTSHQSLSERGEFNTEQAFLSKKGHEIWCRMHAKTVDSESLEKGIIWTWDDTTDHRRAQEELMRAREEAEAANRAKSEFLAAMSHEIRTPMNAIVGMTEITLQTDLNNNQRDYLKTVMDSAQHLLSIINDILDLSKIEARKLSLDRSNFDLPFHIQTTIKGLEIQAAQKGLTLNLDIDESVPVCVKGDPLSLRQILVNLVGNAIKFTHRGSITIRVHLAPGDISPPTTDRNIGIFIEVEDTGIGIPTEFMDTIFQSFSQTTRTFGGTGLGLAICKQLIGLMDGDIHVESTVGKGSLFCFSAWFEPGDSRAIPIEPRKHTLEAPPRSIRILVAEDNDVNVMVTTLRLEELGHTYSVASNGLEVLNLLKREPFDLILMDIEMPLLDGIATTKAIRSAIPGGSIPNPDIPIIGVTAHALNELRDKSIAAGMDDYVSKPVDFHALSLIINRLIGTTTPPKKQKKTSLSIEQQPTTTHSTEEKSEELLLWTPEKAMKNLGVDKPIFNDFLSSAHNELTVLRKEVRQAIGAGDRETSASLARTIQALCTSIGAQRAALAATELETACRKSQEPESALATLIHEIKCLLDIMKAK